MGEGRELSLELSEKLGNAIKDQILLQVVIHRATEEDLERALKALQADIKKVDELIGLSISSDLDTIAKRLKKELKISLSIVTASLANAGVTIH